VPRGPPAIVWGLWPTGPDRRGRWHTHPDPPPAKDGNRSGRDIRVPHSLVSRTVWDRSLGRYAWFAGYGRAGTEVPAGSPGFPPGTARLWTLTPGDRPHHHRSGSSTRSVASPAGHTRPNRPRYAVRWPRGQNVRPSRYLRTNIEKRLDIRTNLGSNRCTSAGLGEGKRLAGPAYRRR